MQSAADLSPEQDLDKRRNAVAKITREMQASLVAGWSFDMPATPENIEKFLYDCPQVASLVAAIADKADLFFGNASPA